MNKTELDLAEYCDGCEFIKPKMSRGYPFSEGGIRITCENQMMCTRIAFNIAKIMEEKKNVRSEE